MITYFIRLGESVKIGKTGNLQKRISQLRVGFPHEPILLNACDLQEKDAHAIAEKLTKRQGGEWFEANLQLVAWIKSLPTTSHECAVLALKCRTPRKLIVKRNKIGRPPTGITKNKPSITMDKRVEKMARKAALLEGLSFSAWVERACRENLATITGKAGA